MMSSKTVTIMIIGKRDQICKLIQNHVEVDWGTIIKRINKYGSRQFKKLSGHISYFQRYMESIELSRCQFAMSAHIIFILFIWHLL